MDITQENIKAVVAALIPERKVELLERAFADLEYNVGFDSAQDIVDYLDEEGKQSFERRLRTTEGSGE